MKKNLKSVPAQPLMESYPRGGGVKSTFDYSSPKK